MLARDGTTRSAAVSCAAEKVVVTASVMAPAALPAAIPAGVSSMTTHELASVSRRSAARKYPSGAGLPSTTSSAVTMTSGTGRPTCVSRRHASARPPEVTTAKRRGSGSVIRIAKSPSLNPAGKPVAVEAWVKAESANGVILARGGQTHGYALLVRRGQPRFVVRINGAIHAVTANSM